MHPKEIFLHPVTGFHVVSVHSIFVLAATLSTSLKGYVDNILSIESSLTAFRVATQHNNEIFALYVFKHTFGVGKRGVVQCKISQFVILYDLPSKSCEH